jgi:large conductance mechanosensitive channel
MMTIEQKKEFTMSTISDFKEFVLRGNVVDLAVGIVVGGAFGTVVKALVADVITPLIGLPGKIDLSGLKFTIHGASFLIGDFLNSIISFLILAFVVFFAIVKPINHLMSLRKTETTAEAVTRECPRCLSSVPAAASRCAFCTSDLSVA